MKKTLNESLIYQILSAVSEIPEGRVATYGQIAALIGRTGTPGSWRGPRAGPSSPGVTPVIGW